METKTIQLKNGGHVIVDEDDFEALNQFRWFRSSGGYAHRQGWDKGVHWVVFMHRVVNKTPDGMFTDHANGVKTDNRKSNLRTCDKRQNSANRPKQKQESVLSQYKGVDFHQKTGYWRARVNDGGFRKTTYHKTEQQAALDYNQMAIERFGEFASLNDVPHGTIPTVRKPKSSRFRGVSYQVKSCKWRAALEKAGKGISLGQYATEEDAARAYNSGALVHFGERARLNEI